MWTELEYMYRDAGNYKAYGTVLLSGSIDPSDRRDIVSKMDDGLYFIAEQVGLPTLYHELEKWSSGPTRDDHCWHEFLDFVEHPQLSEPETTSAWGSAALLIDRFRRVGVWNEQLSPNFEIGGRYAAQPITE